MISAQRIDHLIRLNFAATDSFTGTGPFQHADMQASGLISNFLKSRLSFHLVMIAVSDNELGILCPVLRLARKDKTLRKRQTVHTVSSLQWCAETDVAISY